MTSLLQHSIVREALGAAACVAWLASIEFVAVALARRSGSASRRAEPWLTAAAVLWLVFAFDVVAYFPTAVAVAVAGAFFCARAGESAKTRGREAAALFSPRTTLHGVTAGLALLLWQQGWMFNVIGPLAAHAVSRAGQDAAQRRLGRRRFKAVDAHTVEGMAVYAALSLAIQGAVYWNWSRIPGFMHEPRAVLWAMLGAGAATVARLYAPVASAEWIVPIASALAVYLYAVA
jgi:hypothetical protein